MSTIKENLVDLFQLDKMPPEKAIEMIERLSKLVFQAVLVRALPMLSEEELTQYEKIIEGKEEGNVLFKFLSEKVPNFQELIKEEAQILHDELVKKS